jgi:phytoene dehydrogenase-like protein
MEEQLTGLQQNPRKFVTVIGAGVAGMSAACALAEAGFRVQLVERRGYLGGRASSYLHPGVNEVIDNCQHVLFGCCTNLQGFYRRIGVAQTHPLDQRNDDDRAGRAKVAAGAV